MRNEKIIEVSQKEFSDWVKKMCDRFESDLCRRRYIGQTKDGRIRTTIVSIQSTHMGVAICHPQDKDNRNIGTAIAYARCIGEAIYLPRKENPVPERYMLVAGFKAVTSEKKCSLTVPAPVLGLIQANKPLTAFEIYTDGENLLLKRIK